MNDVLRIEWNDDCESTLNVDGKVPSDTPLVVITKEEYEELLRRDRLLDALEKGGVDNWEWYDESINQHYPEYRNG